MAHPDLESQRRGYPARAAVAAVAVAFGTACTIEVPELRSTNCRETELDVTPVRVRPGEVPTLSARLTSGGSPVVGRDVILGVGVPPAGAVIWRGVAETVANGIARVPMTPEAGSGRLEEALADGVKVVATHRDGEVVGMPGSPRYCHVSESAPFEVGP